MVQIKNVEKKILDLEGFEIEFWQNGHNVPGNKDGLPQYQYMNMAKNDMTVQEWKRARFKKCFPGYDVEVLDGNGQPVHGATKLGNLRDGYQ